MKRLIESDDRMQSTLFPEALDDYMDTDNPVRAINVFVGRGALAPRVDAKLFGTLQITNLVEAATVRRMQQTGCAVQTASCPGI